MSPENVRAAASLPIHKYLLTGTTGHRIAVAQDRLANECMRRFHRKPVRLAVDRSVEIADDALSFKERYGVTTVADARESAYGATDPKAAGMRRLSADDRLVYYGVRPDSPVPFAGMDGSVIRSPGRFRGKVVPAGGCLGRARTVLWGSPSAARKDDLPRRLSLRAYRLSLEDSSVTAAFRRWSACMAGKGFTVSDPIEAQAIAARSEMGEKELSRTALADVVCKERVSLLPVWFAALDRIETQLVGENEPALEVWRTVLRVADQRASEVLAR